MFDKTNDERKSSREYRKMRSKSEARAKDSQAAASANGQI
jgi:hypothetical protein